MDSEAQGAVARLNGLLDELDKMSVSSIGNLENRLSAARAAIEKARHNRGTQQAVVQKSGETAQTKAEDADVAAMRASISQYEKRIAELEALASDVAVKDARIAEMETLASEVAAKDARIAEMEALAHDVAAKDVRIAEMEALAHDVAAKDVRIAEMEALVRDVAAKDARIAEMESLAGEVEKRDALIAEHVATVEKLRNREARYNGVDAKLAAYSEQVLALENTVKERENSMATLRGQLQERDAQIESLRGQIQEHDQQSKVGEDARKEVEAQLAAAKEQIGVLSAEVEKKDAELHGQQEAVVLLKDEVRQREASIAKLEKKIDQGNAEAVALREQLGKVQADNATEDLQRDLDEKTGKLKSIEGALRTTEEDRAKLELEVKMLLGEIEGMRYQHSELEMMQGKITRLESDLQEERAAIVRLKAKQASMDSAPRGTLAPAPQTDEPEQPATQRIRNVATSNKGRRGGRKQMGEILVEAGVLTEEQLAEVIEFQASDPKRKLGSVVVERGYATEEVISAALAAQMHVRFIDNLEQELQPGVIKLIPNHLINNHKCVPLSINSGQLLVAMANPLDLIGIENIELATNLRVEVAAATPSEIDLLIEKYFNRMKAYQ